MANSSGLRQFLAVIPAGIDILAMGIGYGWVAPTLAVLQSEESEIPLDNDQVSWVASLQEFGRVIGPIAGIFIFDYMGRKTLLTGCAFISVLVWLLTLLTSSVYLLYLGRFGFGVGIGFSDVVGAIYIAELTTPENRGKYLAILNAGFCVGIVLGYIGGSYLPYRTFLLIIFGYSVFFLCSCYLLVETPQYLIQKSNLEKARKNLTWLMGDNVSAAKVDAELKSLKVMIEEETANKPRFKDVITDPINLRIFATVVTLYLVEPLTGYPTVTYYVTLSFTSSEFFTIEQFTILFGTVQVFATVLASFLIDKIGRRILILLTSSLSFLVHSVTTVLYYLYYERSTQIPYFSWLVFLTVTTYAALFTFGCISANYALRAELFPQSIKGFGGSAAIVAQGLSAFAMTKMFYVIKEAWGIYLNFAIFAVACIAMFSFTYKFVPETKGKSLIEIQKVFREKYR